MHIYYKKYLEKAKNEIDRCIIMEVESGSLDADVEHYIETLFQNREFVKECLHEEMHGDDESSMVAKRV